MYVSTHGKVTGNANNAFEPSLFLKLLKSLGANLFQPTQFNFMLSLCYQYLHDCTYFSSYILPLPLLTTCRSS